MKFLITILTFLFVSQGAFAGVMLEPFLGYAMGTTKVTTVGGVDSSSKETGPAFGGRVGYKSMLGLWIAGEADLSSGTSKPDAGGTSSDFTHSAFGVTAGFDLIFGLRVFAGYNFVDSTKITTSGSPDITFDGGSSSKIGAGYKFPLIPLAVNFEYFMSSPKKLHVSGIDADVSSVYSSFKQTAMVLSVSAPFNL